MRGTSSCRGRGPWVFTNLCLCSSPSCFRLPGSTAVYPCLLPAGPLPDGTSARLGFLPPSYSGSGLHGGESGSQVVQQTPSQGSGELEGKVAHRQPTASWWVFFGEEGGWVRNIVLWPPHSAKLGA